eukprot:3994446-Pyramimonas_sp.AAC.1
MDAFRPRGHGYGYASRQRVPAVGLPHACHDQGVRSDARGYTADPVIPLELAGVAHEARHGCTWLLAVDVL